MVVTHNCLKVSKFKNDFDFNDLKKLLKNIYLRLLKLLQIAVTIPINSATCERSFSSMRCVKMFLSSMGQERFSYLSILCLDRVTANSIDTQLIVDKFSKKDRLYYITLI